jgi:hypothetical protein
VLWARRTSTIGLAIAASRKALLVVSARLTAAATVAGIVASVHAACSTHRASKGTGALSTYARTRIRADIAAATTVEIIDLDERAARTAKRAWLWALALTFAAACPTWAGVAASAAVCAVVIGIDTYAIADCAAGIGTLATAFEARLSLRACGTATPAVGGITAKIHALISTEAAFHLAPVDECARIAALVRCINNVVVIVSRVALSAGRLWGCASVAVHVRASVEAIAAMTPVLEANNAMLELRPWPSGQMRAATRHASIRAVVP